MDFVQRNLINERNNLQVELAKAKLLIAELSEAATLLRGMEAVKRKSELSGKKLPTEEEASKALKALQRKKEERADAASSGMGTRIKRPNSFKRKFNEEAEYISDLENVIMSIAEQLGVDPNDLLNEVRAVTNAEIAANPVKNARNINRIQAVADRIHNRRQDQGPGMNAVTARKDAYDSERAKHMLNALGVKAAVRTGGIGVKVASDLTPNEAGTALNRDTNIQMGSNDGLRANDALKSNIMTANKAARPAGPWAQPQAKQPQGMRTFLPRSL